MVDIHTDAAIRFWIKESIGTENFTFNIESTTQKGEGYIGDLIFVKVNLQKPIDGKDVLNLVIKTNKKNIGLEQSVLALQELCKREVVFYSKILQEYNKLQTEKKLQNPFDMVPKCYKTFEENGNQVIILENVKKVGYELYPRADTMNDQHLKLGLRTYAKLHALGFALKDQRKDTFEKISIISTPVLKLVLSKFKKIYDSKTPELVETLKDAGRPDLSIIYEKFINEKSVFDRFMDINDLVSKDQTIIHADCHNANMLFKYENNERSTPKHMVLIDFQGACTHSPIIDLSYFLNINLPPAAFPNLKDFVEYYYSEFCSFLKELGSDASTLFPRSTFDEHVKTYIHYGSLLMLPFLEIMYVDNEDTPALIDEETNEFFGGFKDLKIKSPEKYVERLVALVDSLFNGPYS